MKANPDKYCLLLYGYDSSKITIENRTISNNKCEKHLGTYNEFLRNLPLFALPSCMDVSQLKTIYPHQQTSKGLTSSVEILTHL